MAHISHIMWYVPGYVLTFSYLRTVEIGGLVFKFLGLAHHYILIFPLSTKVKFSWQPL